MSDLLKNASEALETATKAVRNLKSHLPIGSPNQEKRDEAVNLALVTVLDVCSALAAIVGVPNAIEPETGKAEVSTHEEFSRADTRASDGD